jgi:hypothetical protein
MLLDIKIKNKRLLKINRNQNKDILIPNTQNIKYKKHDRIKHVRLLQVDHIFYTCLF